MIRCTKKIKRTVTGPGHQHSDGDPFASLLGAPIFFSKMGGMLK
jgi:hypothetical protein